MITELEIVDTAVKIGLGAVISGLAAYWLARLSHRNELDREFAKRRRDKLESLVQDFHAEHVRFVNFTMLTSEMAERNVGSDQAKLLLPVSIGEKAERIETMPDALASIEAQLMLLGEQDAASKVKAYATEVAKYLVFVGNWDVREIKRWQNSEYIKKRDELFRSLSNAYRQH